MDEGVSSPSRDTRTKSSLLRVDTESDETLIFPTEPLSSMAATVKLSHAAHEWEAGGGGGGRWRAESPGKKTESKYNKEKQEEIDILWLNPWKAPTGNSLPTDENIDFSVTAPPRNYNRNKPNITLFYQWPMKPQTNIKKSSIIVRLRKCLNDQPCCQHKGSGSTLRLPVATMQPGSG